MKWRKKLLKLQAQGDGFSTDHYHLIMQRTVTSLFIKVHSELCHVPANGTPFIKQHAATVQRNTSGTNTK